jgi:site-specific DNA-methyltransferase (adenine-specific)
MPAPSWNAQLIHADCLDWLVTIPENTLHAVVTDPPYGLKEYEPEQLEKREGKGGVWCFPPSFDGNTRSPLPRFTALSSKERQEMASFFLEWGKLVCKVLRPGGHVFVATNAFVSNLLFSSLIGGGLEFRGEIIRLVRTLRGGDRPKNAETEFPEAVSMPRGCYEPWGLFRKPLGGRTVAECLREYQTGALRRYVDGKPFEDVIISERTTQHERALANHPSLKPQSLLRRLVYTSLPLGKGVVLDPFMGSGSTIAAAEALGVEAIGVEKNADYFKLACEVVPKLKEVEAPGVDTMVGIQISPLALFKPEPEPPNETILDWFPGAL